MSQSPISQSQPISQKGSRLNSSPVFRYSQSEASFNDVETLTDLNFTDLKNDQERIDSTLKFLLNYNVQKRKPGRPPKTNEKTECQNRLTVPDSVSDSLKTITNVNDLHAGVLLDYLMKSNKLNKILLERLDTLNDKYNSLLDKLEGNRESIAVTGPSSPLNQSSSQTAPGNVLKNVSLRSKETDNLHLKVDTLEQRLNSNILIFSGSIVNNLTEENVETEFLNHVKNLDDNLSSENFNKISVFGKNKKQLKVTCSSVGVKNNILRKSRIRKLENSYFNEFLTSTRHSIFYRLRQLKKRHPDVIRSVYTRNGDVYYKKTDNNNKYINVQTINDVANLELTLSTTVTL